jgi:SLT domain-containing protein
VLQALAMMGMSPAFAPGVVSLIMSESSGNPNAINLWDSNARAGHPSQGLMQTVPGTFAAYVLPSLRGRPITDPIANITAGVRYALATYGPAMLMAGGRHFASGKYMGYSGGGLVGELEARAGGGPVSAGSPYLVGELGPELFVPSTSGQVVSADDTERLAAGALAGVTVYVQDGAIVVNGATDPRATYEAVVQGIGDAVARR